MKMNLWVKQGATQCYQAFLVFRPCVKSLHLCKSFPELALAVLDIFHNRMRERHRRRKYVFSKGKKGKYFT